MCIRDSIKTVMVTSPNASEGKSTTSSNLALALSSVGQRTVLLDVDYRRGRVHDIFGIKQTPGMSDVILNGADMRSVSCAVNEPGLQNMLLVLPTGTVPPSPAAFVGTHGFLSSLDDLRAQADRVVLDAPPILAVSDAHTLGKHVDAVVVTARAGETTKGELTEVLTVMKQTGANVVGIVLIGVEEAETYARQYYYRSEEASAKKSSNGKANLWADNSGGQLIDMTTTGSRSIIN